MVCLDCHLHGKKVHLLHQGTKDEYVFITPKSQVFPETCISCVDPDCPYNFNLKKLLKQKELRRKILDYVFDASFDDMLLEQGLTSSRNSPIIFELDDDAEVYSKPRYSKKNGSKLLAIDEAMIKRREKYFQACDKFFEVLKKTQPAPPRVIIKRKDRDEK